jgi:heme exporter protein C
VLFWNQGLHQGASLTVTQDNPISDVYYWPLITSISGFVLLFLTLVLLRTRTEIRRRRLQALLNRERMA